MNHSSNPGGPPPEDNTQGLEERSPRVPAADHQIWATAPLTQFLVEPRDNWFALARNLHLIGPANFNTGYRYLSRMVELEQYFPGRLAPLLTEIAMGGRTAPGKAGGDAGQPPAGRARARVGAFYNARLCLNILDDIYFSHLSRFPADVYESLTTIVRQPEDTVEPGIRSRVMEILSRDQSRSGEFLELVREQLARQTDRATLDIAARWAAGQFARGRLSLADLEDLRQTVAGRLLREPQQRHRLQSALLHLHQTHPLPAPPSIHVHSTLMGILLSENNRHFIRTWTEAVVKISRDPFWRDFTWKIFSERILKERDNRMTATLWNSLGYLAVTSPPGVLETQFAQWLQSGRLDYYSGTPQLAARILGKERGKKIGDEEGPATRLPPVPSHYLEHLRQQIWQTLCERLTRKFSPIIHATLRSLETPADAPNPRSLTTEFFRLLADPTVPGTVMMEFHAAEKHRLSENQMVAALETLISNHHRRTGTADNVPMSPEESMLFSNILADLPRRSIVTWLINRNHPIPLPTQHVHLILHRLAATPDTHPPEAQTPSRYITQQLLATLPDEQIREILQKYPNLSPLPTPGGFTPEAHTTFIEPLTQCIHERGKSRVLIYNDDREQDPEAFAKTRTSPPVSPRQHFIGAWAAVLEKAQADPQNYLLHLMHTTRAMPIDDLQQYLLSTSHQFATWRPEVCRHLATFLEEVAEQSTGERKILARHLASHLSARPQPAPVSTPLPAPEATSGIRMEGKPEGNRTERNQPGGMPTFRRPPGLDRS